MNLIRASAKGDIAAVKKLVAEGIDVNEADQSGRTALIEAAWSGHSDVVKYLIDKGADVDATDSAGYTAIMRAAEEGRASLVTLLIQKGADVNCRGKVRGTTALMLAAEKGHIKILEILLHHHARINDLDRYVETALARAYRANQAKAAEYLESKGGRGKPERSSYSHSDRESRSSTKVALPRWSAAATEGGFDDEEGRGSGGSGGESESYEE